MIAATGERVLVVNAGSSTLKLSVVAAGERTLAATTEPAPAPENLPGVLERFLDRAPRPAAVGHRVVHGGLDFTAATVVDAGVEERLVAALRARPAAQPARAGGHPGRCTRSRRISRRSPASTRRSMPPSRRRRRRTRCPPAGAGAGDCGASASTGSRTPGRADARQPSSRARRMTCDSSSRTWARAPRSPRCATGAPWTRRWGSPRSTGWSWPRAAERSTPGCCCGCSVRAGWIRRRWSGRSRTSPDCWGSPSARATCGSCWRARTRATSAAGWPSTSTCTGSPAPSPP